MTSATTWTALTKLGRGPGLRLLGIGLLVCAAAACGGCDRDKPAANSGTPGAPVKVRIGYVGLTCEASLFTAYENKFFQEEGLEPELVKTEWIALRDGLALGKFDATQHLVMYLLKPIEQGMDIRLTAGVHRGCLRVQVPAGSPIKTVADLKGKRIGVPGMGTPPFILATRALIAAGLDPEKDVKWEVVPPGEQELAIQKGAVDAVGNAEPIGTMLLAKNKVVNLVDQMVDAPFKDEYCCAVVVSGKLVRENSEVAAKITRAILKGAKWVENNPTAAARLSVEKKYLASNVEMNARAIGHLRYMPSVSGGREAVVGASNEMKKAKMLRPSTDPEQLAKTGFAALPGVTDEWIKGLSVEKVAGGDVMPTEAQVLLALTKAGSGQIKTCCQLRNPDTAVAAR